MRRTQRIALAVAGVAASMVVGGLVATAATPKDEVAKACVSEDGAVRVINAYPPGSAVASCTRDETAVRFYTRRGALKHFLQKGASARGDLTGSYPAPELADGSVDGLAVLDDALTGGDIDESSLGPVPQADDAATAGHADTAGHAGTAGHADTAGDAGTLDGATKGNLVLHCPAGMLGNTQVCVDATQRTAANHYNAQLGCINAGLRLPTEAELIEAYAQTFVSAAVDEENWTSERVSGTEAVYLLLQGTGIGWGQSSVDATRAYRCVSDPFNQASGARGDGSTPQLRLLDR